ncbi:DNA polymerase III subunit gamma and tau [Micromonospora sp. WMMD1082]|uniref:DNA polymerase III subunit gamma and tau n=1 Tax=Micromonospora sp. WMMD1082 TaxID=3016104 RepID=UPI00241656EC|nr:DNA polymerase III subunit gamma and tau [Micromonospora sp. WMMD1082]MDG4794444.1 DNA polymerase III subunit gamma and tau [Micromonospora sp. WMMD1082]
MALALYRKYRPRTFAEVIGQEHVTEPLSQALRSGRLNHAYLFSGPRGCGKTSSARILARSLNCEHGPTPEPCGTCDSCRSLAGDGAGSIDVIEIDAASHGGVDDARELREKAFFAPANSRFKIYVIDEAHMVSSAGFNALLKLVEEPPEYVKFIFATTEPEKVLGTIKSRTHHYPFRLIPPKVLRPYLEQLCEAEGVQVEPAVFPLVVRAGGGSARDSLSVLDQLIAGAGPDGVTYARAAALLGVTDAALIDEMCDALAAGDGAAAYATVDRVAEAGHDPRRFAADLLERLRDLIVLQQVPDAVAKGLIDGPDDQIERMAAHAQQLGPGTLSRCADIVHDGLVEMRGTTAPRLLLELICARMLLPGVDDSTGGLLQRLERMERRLTLAGTDGPPAAADSAPVPTPAAVRTQPPAAPAAAAATRAGTGAAAPAAANTTTAPPTRDAATSATTRDGVTAPATRDAATSAATRDTAKSTTTRDTATSAATRDGVTSATTRDGVTAPATRDGVTSVAGRAGATAPAGRDGGMSTAGPGAGEGGATGPAQTGAGANGAAAARPGGGFSGRSGGSEDGAPGGAATSRRAVPPAAVMPDPATPEPPRPGAVTPGALDAVAVRRVWPEVVGKVNRTNKRIAALMRDAVVRDLDGDTLVLTVKSAVLARMVSDHAQVLTDALYEELGGRWQIRCEVAGERGGMSPGHPRATPAPAAADPVQSTGGASRGRSGADRSGGASAATAEGAEDDWPEPARPGGVAPASSATATGDPDDGWPEAARPGGESSGASPVPDASATGRAGARNTPAGGNAGPMGGPAASAAPGGGSAGLAGGPGASGAPAGGPAASAGLAGGPAAPAGGPAAPADGPAASAGLAGRPGASGAPAGGPGASGVPAGRGGVPGGSPAAQGGARASVPPRQARATNGNGSAGGTGGTGGAPVSSAIAAARAAAAGRGARTAQASRQTADVEFAGEPPYDPDFDGPVRGGAGRRGGEPAATPTYEGFDPGDEPLDEIIDEKTARESSEEQAVRLLREAFGSAEKIPD